MGKLPTDEIALRKKAIRLGVSLEGTADPRRGKTNIPELQSRIINAQRSLREGRLWWIAFVSAVSSLLSALAAWTAVLK